MGSSLVSAGSVELALFTTVQAVPPARSRCRWWPLPTWRTTIPNRGPDGRIAAWAKPARRAGAPRRRHGSTEDVVDNLAGGVAAPPNGESLPSRRPWLGVTVACRSLVASFGTGEDGPGPPSPRGVHRRERGAPSYGRTAGSAPMLVLEEGVKKGGRRRDNRSRRRSDHPRGGHMRCRPRGVRWTVPVDVSSASGPRGPLKTATASA